MHDRAVTQITTYADIIARSRAFASAATLLSKSNLCQLKSQMQKEEVRGAERDDRSTAGDILLRRRRRRSFALKVKLLAYFSSSSLILADFFFMRHIE